MKREKQALIPIDRPEGLTDLAYNAIRQAIIEHQLKPGESVSEASLAEMLNVSKTPVRESLIRLREVGLIVFDGNRGARIVDPTIETIKDAYEVREALEGFSVRLAFAHLTPEALDELELAAGRSIECAVEEDIAGFQEWDQQFHFGIATLAGNERLYKLLRDNSDLVRTFRQLTVSRPLWATVECATAHQEIVTALRRRDQQGAVEGMQRHIQDVRNRVLQVLEAAEAPS
ncbi:MAG: GntR family transcriptional regulator [Ardenticatenaceae bacterium]|nr:GntR family transcriptional regulator [Ardenticatenaceae bacterium]HBY92505.1 hypothetical protein [Chloroflexota bacterium]